MVIKRLLMVSILAASVTACTGTGNALYDWGNYEDNLFSYYHDPVDQEVVLERHLEHLARLERHDRLPAPGLLAEAGTLYLLLGDEQKAIEYFQKEHDLWPESQVMMSALITNLKEKN